MNESINLGDVVEDVKEYLGCRGKVIFIDDNVPCGETDQGEGILLLLDNVSDRKYGWIADKWKILVLKKILKLGQGRALGQLEDYAEKRCWWVRLLDLTLIEKGSFAGVKSHGNVCAKCGMTDEYASPSAKHGGEVRCYRHC